MSIQSNLKSVLSEIPNHVLLVAVSKTHPISAIQEAYSFGQKHFGENKVQELLEKQASLPKDIHWHLIGHLQTNKVKYIVPFIYLIHSVDSLKLLKEINKEGSKNKRIINCLLQVYIAKEETKFGLDEDEINVIINELHNLPSIKICGLMGMASNTNNSEQVREEFRKLKKLFDKLQPIKKENFQLELLSMGMSSDYLLAIEEGSNLIRVGSSIFGSRDYSI